jgi:protein disulfide-isomerase A6
LVPHTLEELIKHHKPFLILFFAPWCGHCIHAKDMYKALAEKMDVYALNADEYGETAGLYGVDGFPTFGMMANGKLQKYSGPRTEDGLMAFSKTFPEELPKIESSVPVDSILNITSLDELRKMDAVITMFYAPWCSHCTHFKPTFQVLAKEHTIPFALVNCDELPDAKSEFGIRGFPTIHKLGLGKVLSTFSDSPRTEDTVRNWIKHS